MKWAIVFVGFVLLFATVCQAETKVPQAFDNVVPVYPKAQVLLADEKGRRSSAVLETIDDPKAVLVFYQKALVLKGWQVRTKTPLEKGAVVSYGKKGDMIGLTVRKAPKNMTSISISLYKN